MYEKVKNVKHLPGRRDRSSLPCKPSKRLTIHKIVNSCNFALKNRKDWEILRIIVNNIFLKLQNFVCVACIMLWMSQIIFFEFTLYCSRFKIVKTNNAKTVFQQRWATIFLITRCWNENYYMPYWRR